MKNPDHIPLWWQAMVLAVGLAVAVGPPAVVVWMDGRGTPAFSE